MVLFKFQSDNDFAQFGFVQEIFVLFILLTYSSARERSVMWMKLQFRGRETPSLSSLRRHFPMSAFCIFFFILVIYLFIFVI